MELKLKRRRYKSFKISRKEEGDSLFQIQNSFSNFYGPGKSKSPNN